MTEAAALPAGPDRSLRRLGGWSAFVGGYTALAYADRFTEGKPAKNVLYTWDAAVGGLIVYAVLLGIVLLICIGADARQLLALRRPPSWARAGGLALLVLVVIWITSGLLDPVLHAGREQGLTPSEWKPSRAAPFAANFVVIAIVAPVVEELTFRGLGYSLLARFGTAAAIVGVGLAFGLAHGLVSALPLLVLFGIGLAVLRSRTGSVYPGMLLHGAFNATALLAAVTLG